MHYQCVAVEYIITKHTKVHEMDIRLTVIAKQHSGKWLGSDIGPMHVKVPIYCKLCMWCFIAPITKKNTYAFLTLQDALQFISHIPKSYKQIQQYT
jgi:hypothetical protein